jgi:hypothetical protein
MTRTTIRMDDHLLRQAKQLAARTGSTLTSIIESALREKLHPRRGIANTPPSPLPVFHGDGLQPGVDLDDSSSLLDLMEDGLPLEKRR